MSRISQLPEPRTREDDEAGRTRYRGAWDVQEWPLEGSTSLISGLPRLSMTSSSERNVVDGVGAKAMFPGCKSTNESSLAGTKFPRMPKVSKSSLTSMANAIRMKVC